MALARSTKSTLLGIAERSANLWYANLPVRVPHPQLLSHCRIIAHRGDHSAFHDHNSTRGTGISENTLAAFDRCVDAGVWGIELDIQWTKDGVPVVIHDTDTGRVFAQPGFVIADTHFAALTAKCPALPSLEQVIARYAGKIHLMIEIKADTWLPEYEHQLAALLRPLAPAEDYHLLCLRTQIFDGLPAFDPRCFLPVALLNTKFVFDYAINRPCAGISGHFVLLNRRMRAALRKQGKHWGTGFLTADSILHREIHSGTRWLFSNHAVALQSAVTRQLLSARRAANAKR